MAIALAFHELSTNAVKCGSLAYGDGNVDIHWTVVANGLRLVWNERGGPLVVSPSRRGFGSQVIEQVLAGELSAKATLDYAEDGLRA